MQRETDVSTEEKIKEAARKVFTTRGFSATRTRDIASEAGINLALLNYYFRSKENLFRIIMQENMQQFLGIIGGQLNQKDLSLEQKIQTVVEKYIDLFQSHPDLPFFIMNEVRMNTIEFAGKMGFKEVLLESHFYKQLKQKAGKSVNPLHFLLNILGLAAFPFIAAPMMKFINGLNHNEYHALMEERKRLIPHWIEVILNSPQPANS